MPRTPGRDRAAAGHAVGGATSPRSRTRLDAGQAPTDNARPPRAPPLRQREPQPELRRRRALDDRRGLGARGARARGGAPRAAAHALARRVGAAMRAEEADVVIVKGKKAARMAAFGRATGGHGRVAFFLGATHELERARWVDRFTWRAVDAGIVVAHGAARWYAAEGFGPPAKMHVLWKGVDLARFDRAHAEAARKRAELGLASDEIAVGTVGRLAWQKGIDDLLEAVRRLRPRLPRARFFVAGGGRD